MAQMRAPEALRILEAKLAAIEQEHQTELEESEGLRGPIDARAEARALTAVLDFLENCKIKPGASLLRLFRRYVQAGGGKASAPAERRVPHSRAS
ncbi:MAG TPA: hypothetical protein VLB11_01070 [Methyloceanibacter sp.]|nr:hypothetical protein [Methyloceanibacter sp.]